MKSCTKFLPNVIFSNPKKPTHIVNMITEEIISEPIRESILSVESQGPSAMKKFVEERICGDINLWDKMSKCKISPWNSSAK